MKDSNPYIRIIGYRLEDEPEIIQKVKNIVFSELGKNIEGFESSDTRDNRAVLELFLPITYILFDKEIRVGIDQASTLLEQVENTLLKSFSTPNIEISIEFP